MTAVAATLLRDAVDAITLSAASFSPVPRAGGSAGGGGGASFTDKVAAASAVLTLFAVLVAAATYWQTQRQSRRERRATAFAEALQAVEEYMEAPYRIRRRPHRDAAARWQITESISAVKARVSFHRAWLQTERLPEVCAAYESLVQASWVEGGQAMTQAWAKDGIKSDDDVPLGEPYPRPRVDQAREAFLATARRALGR